MERKRKKESKKRSSNRFFLIVSIILLIPAAAGATYYGLGWSAYEKQVKDLNDKAKSIESMLQKDATTMSDADFEQLHNMIDSYKNGIDTFEKAHGTIAVYQKEQWHQKEVEKHRVQYKDFIGREQALISLKNKPAQPKVPDKVEFKRGETYGKIRIPSIQLEVALSEGLSPDKNDTARDGALLDYKVAHVSTTKHPGQKSQIYLAGHNDMQFNALGNIQDKAEIFIDMPYGTFKYIVHAAPAPTNPEQKVGKVVEETRGDAIQPDLGYEELILQTCYPLNQFGDTPYRFLLYAYPEGQTPKVSLPEHPEIAG